jgi:hypothetical protein
VVSSKLLSCPLQRGPHAKSSRRWLRLQRSPRFSRIQLSRRRSPLSGDGRDLHTVCRSFPKICDRETGRPDPACLQHMQRGPHARSSCRRWLCLQRPPRISTPPSAAHLLNAHQLFVQNFAADRDRQHDLQSRQSECVRLEKGIRRARPGACPCGGWGRHFSRAGETVARSTDTQRTRCSDPSPTLFIRWDRCHNDARQCSPATVIPLSPPPPRHLHQVQTDASVTIRPLIATPARRVSRI